MVDQDQDQDDIIEGIDDVNYDHEYGPLPDPEVGRGRPISVGELTHRCNAAAQRMGVNNPNKLLLLNCGYALQQLFRRIDELENPRIIT